MTEYQDFPKAELVRAAAQLRRECAEQGQPVNVYFKATCPQCGERPAFSEPNITFDTMECCGCGTVFPFTHGNYMVTMVVGD